MTQTTLAAPVSNNMLIPTAIVIAIMYRDGCNYKTAESYELSNSSALTLDVIEHAMEEIGTEDVLSNQWGLPSLSPVNHPSESAGPDDHCYNEITDITYLYSADESDAHHEKWMNDISVIVEAVKNEGLPEWFVEEQSIIDSAIADAKATLTNSGYTMLNKAENAERTAQALPLHIDKELLLRVAAIGLTNNHLITFLIEQNVGSGADLYALQAAITRNLDA
jgi:hypothetical protein